MADTGDVVYKANLNIEDILSGLVKVDKATQATAQRIDAHFKKAGKSIGGLFVDTNGRIREANGRFSSMGNAAAQGFKQAEGSARTSGVQIGAVSGIVSSLTTAFINLGQQAVGALVSIGEKSVQTALEMDTLKARLFGIFDGSQEAADQAFGFIQQKSKELGIDLGELAGAFLPKTESLEQFERVAKIATALARSDPEQGAIGARIAIIEALSGTFTSLQRRFEIPKEDINLIKEAFDKEGIEGFIRVLEETLAKSGKSFDDLADTASTAFARLNIAGEQLGGRIGVPIVASLEEAANKILEFINTNEDDLIVFADTIGRSIGDVIDLISSIDLGQFDTQTLIDVADSIFRIINAVELAAGQFIGLVQVFDDSNNAGNEYASLLTNIDDALVSLAGILALTKAAFAAAAAGAEPFIKSLKATAQFATGDVMGGLASSVELTSALLESDLNGSLVNVSAGQEAFNKSILESNEAFQLYHDALSGNTAAQDELRQKLDETKNAGTDAADAIQAAAAAERQAAEDAEALAAAQAKVAEAMAEAKQDFDRKLEDVEIAHGRKLLDIQLEFAQKREDAARNNLQKLADIQTKNQQDITDAATDLERKEEDIARKFAHERIDLEKEQRQSRLDIETSFREKLQDIQTQSSFDLDEAERNRDAVGFLRILRQQQQQVSAAQTDRQREIDELRVQGERKKEELRTQQQREVEEAHIANEQKLEDLRLNLERQIEAQNIAYAQQIEDIAIGEQRKNEEAATARERDIEDAKLAYERKLLDLQESLAAELAIIAAGNAAIEEEAKRHAAEMAAAAAQERASAPVSDTGRPSSRPGAQNRQRQYAAQPSSRPGRINQGRSFGGLVNAGGSYPVGERGPELFTPNANGRIIPSNALVMSGMTPKSVVNNISSSRTNAPAINFPVGDAGLFNDPIFMAKLRNYVLTMMDGVS